MPTESNKAVDAGYSLVILLPTLRVDAWLKDAVASVLADLEDGDRLAVLLDGGVVEPGQDWLQDDRIILRHSAKRMGVARQLRGAIEAIPAELYARLDADDISSIGRFSAQKDYLAKMPEVVLVAGNALKIDSAGVVVGSFDLSPSADIRRDLLDRNVVVHSTVMFRRESYRLAGGYDQSLRQMEDYDLWLRLGRLGPIALIAGDMVSYRLHDGQVSRRAAPWGAHIRAVQRNRRKLGRYLGFGIGSLAWRSMRWWGGQLFRYVGLRRARYDMMTASASEER